MSLARVFFVTGTDTDAGKTLAACAMLAAARRVGYSTAALKPLAAGVIPTGAGPQNEDAVLLKQFCSLDLKPSEINPVCFSEAIAPHIAAEKNNISLQAQTLASACEPVLAKKADFTLIEGEGGWRVPLNDTETAADVVRLLKIPVILVVGMRLGCLNHALLTAESIRADGLKLAGWIANRIDPAMNAYEENLEKLKNILDAPLLGEIPYLHEEDVITAASRYISLDKILKRVDA